MTAEPSDQGRAAADQDLGAAEVELSEDLLDQVAGAGLYSEFVYTFN